MTKEQVSTAFNWSAVGVILTGLTILGGVLNMRIESVVSDKLDAQKDCYVSVGVYQADKNTTNQRFKNIDDKLGMMLRIMKEKL